MEQADMPKTPANQKMADLENAQTNYFTVESSPLSWTQRLAARLGYGTCLYPELQDLSGIMKGCLHTRCYIQLSWADIIRVLFTGKLFIAGTIETSELVEHMRATYNVSVIAQFPDEVPPGEFK